MVLGPGAIGAGLLETRCDLQRAVEIEERGIEVTLRLFSQSCGVCHTLVQQRSRQYAPALSRETLGGDEGLMREYISNGTPRMPGFRFNFEPTQINSIVSYLKTITPQATPAGAR